VVFLFVKDMKSLAGEKGRVGDREQLMLMTKGIGFLCVIDARNLMLSIGMKCGMTIILK